MEKKPFNFIFGSKLRQHYLQLGILSLQSCVLLLQGHSLSLQGQDLGLQVVVLRLELLELRFQRLLLRLQRRVLGVKTTPNLSSQLLQELQDKTEVFSRPQKAAGLCRDLQGGIKLKNKHTLGGLSLEKQVTDVAPMEKQERNLQDRCKLGLYNRDWRGSCGCQRANSGFHMSF